MSGAEPRPRPLLRYLLVQIPDIILVGLGLAALHEWAGLQTWAALAVLGAWIAKDVAFYPLVRSAFQLGESEWVGVRRMIGARGIVTRDVAPEGWVRVGSELWRARSVGSDTHFAVGEQVRVREVRGMTVLIETDSAES